MLDQDTWRFINTFAPWMSAFGTLAAVVTSLYLARRTDRIRLKLDIGIRILSVQGAGPGHGTQLVFLCVTNIGRRTATVTHLYWKPVPWRKSGILWIAPQNIYSSVFPITLADGQSANYASPLEDFRQNFSSHAKTHFAGVAGAVRLHLTRMCVGTSTGEVFRTKLEEPLRKLFRGMARRKADS
jgi:hypothetical protein